MCWANGLTACFQRQLKEPPAIERPCLSRFHTENYRGDVPFEPWVTRSHGGIYTDSGGPVNKKRQLPSTGVERKWSGLEANRRPASEDGGGVRMRDNGETAGWPAQIPQQTDTNQRTLPPALPHAATPSSLPIHFPTTPHSSPH